MNIKFIAERINKNYDSDFSMNRSKSCTKDNFSYCNNIDEQLQKETANLNKKRYLIDKKRYELLENEESLGVRGKY